MTEHEQQQLPELDPTTRALMSLLVGGYPGVRLTTANEIVYARELQRFDPRDAQAAIESLIRTYEHFPKPAALVQEVARIRTERVRIEENARANAITRRPSNVQMPTQSEWGAVLPRMLEEDARHRRLMAAHRRRKRLEPRREDDCPFVELASRGAAGKVTSLELMRAFAQFGLGGGH